jgi:Tfp pilus assembly protein PilO
MASPEPKQGGGFLRTRPLSGRERTLLIVGFIAVYAVGFVFLVYQPYTERIAALERTLKQEQDELSAAMAIFHRLDEINARIDELNAQMANLDLLVPGSNRTAHFLYACGQWERQTGARVVDIIFNLPLTTGEYEEYTVNFTVIGTFTAQVGFLARLEGMSRLVRVDSVTLDPQDATAPVDPGGGTPGDGGGGSGGTVATTDITTARYVVHLFVDPAKAAAAAQEQPGAGLNFTLDEGRRTPFLP